MKPAWTGLLLLVLPFVSPCQMPDYHVQVFNESDGIRNYNFRSMVRDQNDFLWLLYDTRIQRFDGRQIKEFFVPGTLFSLLCDGNNRIWCTTRNQVYRFKNDYEGFQPM